VSVRNATGVRSNAYAAKLGGEGKPSQPVMSIRLHGNFASARRPTDQAKRDSAIPPQFARASLNRPGQPVWTSIILMSLRPAECGDDHDVIHLGGETAVVVPLHEYGMLAALRKRASAEEIAEAEIDAAIAEHEAWKAAGRPGGTIPHEVAMAELLGGQ
jgi:hypothetical protein